MCIRDRLEEAKDKKEPEAELTPSAPEESQLEEVSKVKKDEKSEENKKELEVELTPSAPEESQLEKVNEVKEDEKIEDK